MSSYYDTVFAVFDLVGLDHARLNRLLQDNDRPCGPDRNLWLADTYDGLQSLDESGRLGTETPVDPAWRSPWVGKSMDDILSFMKGLPQSHVAINREHFVVITHTLEERGTLWCYRFEQGEGAEDESTADEETERNSLTRFACKSTEAAEMLFPLQSGDWERYVEEYTVRLDHDDADWWGRGIPRDPDQSKRAPLEWTIGELPGSGW